MEKLAKLIYTGIIIAILYFVFPFFMPFIIALILAVLFEPLILFVQDKVKMKRIWSVSIVFTGFFTFIFWLIYISFSKIFKEGLSLTKSFPNKIESLISDEGIIKRFYSSFSPQNQEYIKDTFFNLIGKLSEFISSYAGGLFSIVKAFPVYFVAFIVFLVATYIISIQLPTLKSSILKYFEKGQSQKKIEIMLDKLKLAVIGFLRAQLIFSAITFLMCAVGLQILGFKYIIILSLLVVIVDILPILGTGAVFVPWSIYLLATGGVFAGVGLIILYLIITIVRKIIEPKMLGESIGLAALPTLVSMYVFFELMGLLGMVVGPAILIVVQALEEAELLKLRLKV